MTKWVDIQQNTDEWLAMRCGKVGGSSLGTIMANFPKAFGDPAHAMAVDIALEQIVGERQENGYTNEHMQRGQEQEPIARALYEQEYFCTVTNGGYFDAGVIGVSPDGLIDDDGMIEIKCVIAKVHFATVKRGAFDPSYKWQLFAELKYSGREWNDFVSFCSVFPEGRRLFVDRIYAEKVKTEFSMIDSRLAEFCELVNEKKSIIMRG